MKRKRKRKKRKEVWTMKFDSVTHYYRRTQNSLSKRKRIRRNTNSSTAGKSALMIKMVVMWEVRK